MHRQNPGSNHTPPLYSATNLSAPGAWSAVTNARSTTNGVGSTTLPPTNTAVFYRLISQ
jgi:hypothetical protein